TRDICSSSNNMDPETSCSEAIRASRSSRTYCAAQSVAGTVNLNATVRQLGTLPVIIGLSSMSGPIAHTIRHLEPRGPTNWPWYCHLNSYVPGASMTSCVTL